MAVGPTRALLAAYFQSSLARSTKEMSRQGLWALIFLATVLGLFVATPVAFGLFMAGYSQGARLAGPGGDGAVTILGAVLTLLIGMGGIMGGLLGGAKKLSWEQYRVFPVRRPQLFLAELIAGTGDVLVLGLAFGLFAFILGLGIASPRLIPLLALVFVEQLLLLLVIQLLLGSLAQRLAKRLKLMVGILFAIVWLGSMLMGTVAPRKGEPRPEVPPVLRIVLERGVKAIHALPTTSAMKGLQAAAQGHPVEAVGHQLYPLLLVALLGFFAAKLLEREQEALAPAPEKGKHKLWSFKAIEEGLGRLQLRTLLSSHHGKFGFVMPVMTVVFLRGPLSHMQGTAFWAIPGAFAYLALFGNQFQFNQFGLDGHGVKGLFLLPISARQLLDGKLRGFAFYQGLQGTLLIALMIPLFHPAPAEVIAGLALGACFFLVQSAIGAFTSAWMPRRIDRTSLKNNQMPLPLVLVGLGVSLGCSLLFGGAFALLKWFAPNYLLPAMAILAGACWVLHRLLVNDAAAYIERRRETIVEAMG
jgi:ABC-type multidrug transport system permease subunit